MLHAVRLNREQASHPEVMLPADRNSTRLNSSHTVMSYAVFCLKKKIKHRLLAKSAWGCCSCLLWRFDSLDSFPALARDVDPCRRTRVYVLRQYCMLVTFTYTRY